MKDSFILNSSEMQKVFLALRKRYAVWAPVKKSNAGRFSDQDLIAYGEIEHMEDIVLDKQTFFSPKEIVFPVREPLFRIEGGELKETALAQKPVLAILRSCDIHALAVMDAHFLSGDWPDLYYQRRRSMIKTVLLECPEPFAHCYCLSLGTAAADNYAMFLRVHEGRYEWIVRDREMISYFPDRKTGVALPKPVSSNPRTIAIPDRTGHELFTHNMWKEYSRRCIACGRCNTSCPTCTCFAVWDVKTGDETERRRIWSACQVKKFSLLAGNHDFRVKNGDRMRYKVLHKIRDFRKKTGRQMCVGCGRCDLVCPEYISMFRAIDTIQAITRGIEGRQ